MDILIDLIIWIIRASTASRQAPAQRTAPPSQQDIDRQKADVERRIREMQSALAQQTGKGAALPKQVRKVKRTVKQSAPPSLPMPASATAARQWTVQDTTPAATAHRETATFAQRSYIMPLLLGEILAPPLSLREPGSTGERW